MVVVVVGRGGGEVTCESPRSSAFAELPASPAFSANSAPSDCSRSRVEGRSSAHAHATGGCSGRQADSGRTGEAGCCAADVEGTIGAAEVAEAAPSRAAGAAAVAVPPAPVRWGCDNCGGNGPLAAGRYQTRLELQLMRPPQ